MLVARHIRVQHSAYRRSTDRTLLGWERLTTNSSSNVLNTDWREVYSAPPLGQANAGVTAIVATSYTILSSDMGKVVTFSNASPVAVSLPQAGSAGFEINKCLYVVNLGAGLVTVTPTPRRSMPLRPRRMPPGQAARCAAVA